MTIGIENTYTIVGEAIRVRGIVQGVGFRPTVWRIANACGLAGEVVNDADGVLIHVMGHTDNLDEFVKRIKDEAPPLARIDSIERQSLNKFFTDDQFRILPSDTGDPRTGIAPDAATCGSCIKDILNPKNRRFGYPFTNCTHCGPRLSIIKAIPYDRCNTSMTAFTMCGTCDDEYNDPSNRRFHAQPNACPVCGPYIWLEHADNKELSNNALTKKNNLDTVCTLLKQGGIVAIKGIGGFHLACDAINENAVKRLRHRKQRYYKPFALMARNIEIVKRYCEVDAVEEQLLLSASAPIVLLKMNKVDKVADTVAPGHTHLGFMLPYSPIHHLILKHMEHPIILTSGNLSDEPQCIDNTTAKQKLNSIVDYFLFHDREIVNRVDDSVVRIVANDIQILR
ncbi:MAG: carbamoyltransferase HypF, partial [Proteobacteria bacterium]|nr:carbamoyltransferase HypF [Pseudomonadota bacterium]